MPTIRVWLDDLGLGDHADTFEAEEITLELVATLSDGDLKELGLPPAARQAVAAALEASAGVPDDPDSDAERRQISVMFCNMVGASELSEQVDPEELRDVMAAHQRDAAAAVERYGGHVAQYLGDGIMAYFGWPTAHEDDAERAVRAALDAVSVDTVSRSVQARVGIATGSVVVGDNGGGDPALAQTAVGETPNLAARLQALAEPREVMISEATQRLVRGVLDCQERGPYAIKGLSGLTPVWRVIGESDAAGRFEASSSAIVTPLVGRDNEIGLLLDRWEQVLDGDGQIVLVSGEPGVGKSRLISAFRDELGDQPHVRFRYQCSAHHTNSAFHPVIEHLTRAAKIIREDTPARSLDKLEALLSRTVTSVADAAPLFAALLSIECAGRYAAHGLGPQQLWDATTESLLDQLRRVAAEAPALVVFEDAHWMDPTTRDTIARIIEFVQDLRILVVITYRPEFEPPWRPRGHVAQLSVARLNRRRAVQLVSAVTDGVSLPDQLSAQIVEKADGIPLYIEEMTKAVLESGTLEARGDRFEPTGPLPPLAIPSTLQDSLMARLDRLGAVKDVAQIGAVVGREFSYHLMSKVVPMEPKELDRSLARLVETELVQCRGDGADAVYVFKNALIQDVAYGALLRRRRRALHGEIAKRLDADAESVGATEPEVIAHHYTEAGMTEPAVRAWLRAGKRAAERSANQEAAAHFENGLALTEDLEVGDARTDLEIELQLAHGTTLIATRGLIPQVKEAFTRARDLSAERHRERDRYVATWGLWHYANVTSAVKTATGLAEELLGLAREQDDTGPLLQAHHANWTTNLYKGVFAGSREHSEHGIATYDAETHNAHKFVYGGHDPGVCSRAIGSVSLWALGYPDQALDRFLEGTSLADSLGHPMSRGQSRTYGLWTPCLRGDVDLVASNAALALDIATEHGIMMYTGRARIMLGWVAVQQGNPGDAIPGIERGLEECEETGSRMGWTLYYSILAGAFLGIADFDRALDSIDRAMAFADETGERWYVPDIVRIKGEILLAMPSPDLADIAARFESAKESAHRTESRSLELRAATSLAHLLQGQGNPEEARAVLGPIHDWFKEGFATADLKAADALLSEL
jgi:class 3 adenylate cyclase/predicted ATPase